MGYTTEFTGALTLERKLTFAEARVLLEIYDAGGDDERGPRDPRNGRGAYLQWLPTEDLQHIVWDGEEKFYDYIECMEWLCDWLKQLGIGACGSIKWSGEDVADIGEIIVVDNVVTNSSKKHEPVLPRKPLTMKKLGELALAELTA